MSTGVMRQYALLLSAEELDVLGDVLEEVFKTTRVEAHRTNALGAKEVVQARESKIESLLQKTRAARQT